MIERDTASVKIVDFGVAKVKNSVLLSTNTQARIGTDVYMSPEQLGGKEITAASDIYSMAIVAYEMLTGRRPFRPASRVNPMDLRPDLSSEAQFILLKALSFKPQSRYATAGEFGRRLASALSVPPEKTSDAFGKPWATTATVAVMLALLSLGIYIYINWKEPASHSFRYWITVQEMRAGLDYQQPYPSFGKETFKSGDKFQLNVSTDESGYLYIFNEGPPEPASTSFNLIYPNQITNSGSAAVGTHQPVQSGWITFRGPAGAENFWIVWSSSPITGLEALKAEAFNHPDAGLNDQNLAAVREFLRVKESEIKVRITHFESSQTAVVSGHSEILIAHVEFKHR
jgi:serine/threonine protein kinase